MIGEPLLLVVLVDCEIMEAVVTSSDETMEESVVSEAFVTGVKDLDSHCHSPDLRVVVLGRGILVDAEAEGGRGAVEGALLLAALPVDHLVVARVLVDEDAEVVGRRDLVPAGSVVGAVLFPAGR